ncbi:MAG TPA: methylglyoxal synthase [Anaerolineales bacterium]|nr:methylglyoxal synthase [Anaerolineales bacterium]
MTEETSDSLPVKKYIALIAHDARKDDILEWVKYNIPTLQEHDLCATGTTGKMIVEKTGLNVTRFRSGPLGGDMQIGGKIADGEIDLLIFFWDPLEPQPHDPDVKALLRIAVLYNIPTACNRATADFLISSPLLNSTYARNLPDFDKVIDEIREEVEDEADDVQGEEDAKDDMGEKDD